jgi:hypothetical protein
MTQPLQKLHARWAVFVLSVLLAGVGIGLALRKRANATPPEAAAPLATAPVAPVAVTPPDGKKPELAANVQPAQPQPQDDKAHITFTTVPSTNATVVWGKTQLGRITPKQPLVVVRPRDSGPIDVMVYAPGYLPVQTRAHTYGDTRIQVKLTTPDNKQTLFGYRAPLDAGPPADQLPMSPGDTITNAPP